MNRLLVKVADFFYLYNSVLYRISLYVENNCKTIWSIVNFTISLYYTNQINNPLKLTIMCYICNGYPNCPVCGEEVEMIGCPECDGVGEIEAEDGEMCECEKCDGTGEIEAEQYEPDPDEKYDNRY